jgi:cytochrome c biogenesis protein CcmG, thiol:disulfide interchange protein DsbE
MQDRMPNRDAKKPPTAPQLRPAATRRSLTTLAPLLIFAAVAVMFAFALRKGDPSKLTSVLIGKAVPAFTLTPLDGLVENGSPVPAFTPADLAKGGPTVVNFWASWCRPCVEEHPQLVALKKRASVKVVGINYKDQDANARRFLSRYGNPFDAVGADAAGRAALEWGVYGMPETFVVDGRGVIVFKHVGEITPEILENKLLPAIAAAARTP